MFRAIGAAVALSVVACGLGVSSAGASGPSYAQDEVAAWSVVSSMVGRVSFVLDRYAPEQLVADWWSEAASGGLSGLPAGMWVEAENVGFLSEGLSWPNVSEVYATAEYLASVGALNPGSRFVWSSMPSVLRQEYAEAANVQWLGCMNLGCDM